MVNSNNGVIMGYTTEFQGKFELDKKLTDAHSEYLFAFNESRRMTRNVDILETKPDPLRQACDLPLGEGGEYFVGTSADYEDYCGESVVDGNEPPSKQPSLYCGWIPSDDRCGIEHDGEEKFYDYIKWLEYIIDNFIKPWGYVMNGVVHWRGEEFYDVGSLCVKNNVVSAIYDKHCGLDDY